MEASIEAIVIILVVLIGLFFLLRAVNNWYWKINERIDIQHKTNILLEKILIQLGATNPGEVTVEEVATGQRKTITIEKWIEFKRTYPGDTKLKIVKSESTTEANKQE